MSEILFHLGRHARAQLIREQAQLRTVHDALRDYKTVARASAQALRLVADDRDAYAYYRVGQELDLDWDFSSPETTCDLSRSLDRVAFVLHSRPCPLFSGAALACASRVLAEHLGPNKELEQAVLWLRDLCGSLWHLEDDVRACADLLHAAADVHDFQLQSGISMRVSAVCADGPALKGLASGLREFADAIARYCDPERAL